MATKARRNTWDGEGDPLSRPGKNWGNFTPVNHETRYRLIWRSYGGEKTGKDHFGLTAPGPIAIQSFDIGLEGVVEKFLKAPLGPKEIRFVEYEFERGKTSRQDAEDLRDRFIADFEHALTVARTIIWDTETEVWEVFRTAEHGTNKQGVATDAPKDYVKLNAMYRDLIQLAYDADVNLQLIQKVKEKWISVPKKDENGRTVGEKPSATGEMEPTGFKECGYLVQANLRHSWDKENGFVVHVVNCRQNMGIAGQEFAGLDFPTMAQLVFPESSEEQWQ